MSVNMQRVHDMVIESLAELADLESQRRSWLEDAIPFLSPVELICSLFDDSAVGELLEAGPVFSPATDAMFHRLHALVDATELDLPPAQLLASPAWLALAAQAARVLEQLKQEQGRS